MTATRRPGHKDHAALGTTLTGKVACAALVRLRTAMPNDWIAAQLAMGGNTYVSSLVNRVLKDPKARRALATHERPLDTQQETQ